MTTPLQQVQNFVDVVREIGIENFSTDMVDQIISAMNHATETITRFREERPANVDQLYLLAGGNQDAFQSYLSNFPDARTNALSQSPIALHDAQENLRARFGEGIDLEKDGIPHAPFMSSTVWGSQYDQDSGNLKVRFNNGSVYEYGGVPPQVVDLFQNGAAEATTDGENEWGRWWRHKSPSLGSALNQFLKAGGFPYQKLK